MLRIFCLVRDRDPKAPCRTTVLKIDIFRNLREKWVQEWDAGGWSLILDDEERKM